MDNLEDGFINYKVDLGKTELQEQSKLDLVVSGINSQKVGIDGQIKIDGKEYKSLNNNNQSHFKVDQQTGLTTDRQEFYQYNIRIRKNELLSDILA